ncbi:eye-specific diacylglycerol kinase isoform X1 [Leptopilina boulardi]|uniref:eye-specific diacylglycerol kinase isoform X1 n=1 Tax=Leptopilina boulardi TaxID=63433 RepID=UPI0021F60A4D|nr:eye-specific diacylglycerol kinase isoform X1 [Leptopilina boulardi]XP_051159648.1 eye-specific diacylglycerol kinase isoform X1 [Leptopilina boulardi]XP_051159649.1 eye-specific diacylglycerol kinase isoform X1 [Leptopilina boulardi]
MQKLRSTFKRSRTPTGSEMKSQSSLEVPKQVRSASFDEIQLEVKRHDECRDLRLATRTSSSSSSCSPVRSQDPSKRLNTLRVPQLQSGQRSKSFDVCERSLFSERLTRKPETPVIQVSGCYHCACVEEYKSLYQSRDDDDESSSRDEEEEEIEIIQISGDDVNNDDNDDDEEEEEEEEEEVSGDSRREGSPEIRVTLMTYSEKTSSEGEPELEALEVTEGIPCMERRRSFGRLSRQEALTSFPIEFPTVIGGSNDDDDDDDDDDDEEDKSKLVVRDIFLTVPELKRDRAASVDSCFNNTKNGKSETGDSLLVPQQNIRSKSVDIVLPTDIQTRYTALLPGNEALRGGREESGPSSSHREPRSTPDWGSGAVNGEHLWVPTAASGDFCYVNDCSKHGPRMKCAACRVVTHVLCFEHLNFACKSSFRDVGVRQYREQTQTHHHWVHRRSQKGKCSNCGKSFQSKLSFSSKEIIAVSCSWCKTAYHNKESCFNVDRIGENCELGTNSSIIVPPSWIVKLPKKGSFKSSLRKSPRRNKKTSGSTSAASSRRKIKDSKEKENNKEKEKDEKEQKLWVIKPIPTTTVKPVIVFINPKSGGNQGSKLLQKFQWLLNPRQVFDLTQGGPRMGLELFQKTPNLRVLACGGDGTVGWVLSVLDQIGVNPSPAVGVLPLGTGNDLARALGWGGGYTDEPISKILSNIGDSENTLLDRWQLTVERNPDAKSDEDASKGKENLPLNVVNNYYSLGVDAHIALEFHEAREAHPERFNSRLRNKMFYGQMGGKDLVRRKWKDLSEFVTLECDGTDMTPKLKEHRVHAIVFLNIASYGGGTHPWGGGIGKEPSTDDGLIEVVGLTTYQLPLLQAGGHGTSIAQCSKAKLITTRTIPMQVDGEACRLLPSIINMSLLNKATMLAKRRSSGKPYVAKLERLKLPVMMIKMSDYETFHSDKERLKMTAIQWLADPLDLDATTDLESLRNLLAKDHPMDTCCFLDSCTAERFFRIDKAQEQLHYVTDVAVEAVYVLQESTSHQETGNKSQSATNSQRLSSESRTRVNRTVTDEKMRPESRSREASIPEPISENRSASRLESVSKIREHSRQASRNSHLSTRDYENEDKFPQGPSKQSSTSKSHLAAGQSHNTPSYISPQDRLFSLDSEVHMFHTGLTSRPCDGVIRAAKMGDLPALKALHNQGFSLLTTDANGQTALHLAACLGHRDIVRYLIACAPPSIINMTDNDKGQTALHKAAESKFRSICCMLVAGGANLTLQDRKGNVPRDIAMNANDRELAAYLHSQEQFQMVTGDMDNLP